eukprot:TRINITY_DN143_c0_g2_i1.p2 TRINITY_DN143_c0_g2~~TRINITY_DN143_c0_g2_i1.p2  ORF type:complete len:158 (+),score=40.49 TRINITY_DN143_c0_g2_i1:207-680(+)
MSRHPEVVWAQRTEKVFLTIELPDAKDPKVKLEPEGKLTFSATAGAENQAYDLDLDLFEKINVEGSKINVGLRHTFIVIEKEDKGWWKRLLKAQGKTPPYVKVDWNKWVDEDEEKDAPKLDNFDLGGMDDFSDLNVGGHEPDSDDDEDLPELEKATA